MMFLVMECSKISLNFLNFYPGKSVVLLKKEKGKRIQGVHNNKQRTTKQKAKKHRNQEAMLREFHL